MLNREPFSPPTSLCLEKEAPKTWNNAIQMKQQQQKT